MKAHKLTDGDFGYIPQGNGFAQGKSVRVAQFIYVVPDFPGICFMQRERSIIIGKIAWSSENSIGNELGTVGSFFDIVRVGVPDAFIFPITLLPAHNVSPWHQPFTTTMGLK
jgi:hypothetical protein